MQKLLVDGPERASHGRQLSPEIPHPVLQHWLTIVMESSFRESSLPCDKLPALSALAVFYAPVFGPEYLAGIWARSAVQQLCWRRQGQFFKRTTQYRAPSWSWAALNGPVYFPSFLLTDGRSICVPYHRFKIVEWQTCLKAENVPYGEVAAGKLTVTAVFRAATFDPSSSPTIRFNAATNPNLQDVETPPLLDEPGLVGTAQGEPDTVEDNYTRPVRCLAMYRDGGPESALIGGLMLVESSGHDSLFRRMGWFSADVSAFEDYPTDAVSIL